MSNQIYKQGIQGLISGGIDLDTDVIKIALVKSYTPNITTHRWLSDLTGAGGVVAATSAAIGSVTVTDGVFDCADLSFIGVAAGAACQQLVFYKDTGVAGTSALIAVIDTATGLPVTPDGGNIAMVFDNTTNKIINWSP